MRREVSYELQYKLNRQWVHHSNWDKKKQALTGMMLAKRYFANLRLVKITKVPQVVKTWTHKNARSK